jgi:hypothetical protein
MRERAWPYGYIIADPDFRFETPDAPDSHTSQTSTRILVTSNTK